MLFNRQVGAYGASSPAPAQQERLAFWPVPPPVPRPSPQGSPRGGVRRRVALTTCWPGDTTSSQRLAREAERRR